MRLNDFLISCPDPGLEHAAAALGCHLMWWSDNNNVDAPFRKLNVVAYPASAENLTEEARSYQSICVCHFVEPRQGSSGTELRFCCDLVLRALDLASRDLGWRSPLLEAYLHEVAEAAFPLVARFPCDPAKDRATGSTFHAERWSAPGRHAVVLVRTWGTGSEARIPLDERLVGGLYEVDFVIKRLRVKDGRCEARDRSGAILASAPVDFVGTLGPLKPPSGTW